MNEWMKQGLKRSKHKDEWEEKARKVQINEQQIMNLFPHVVESCCLPEMPANAIEWMKWIEFPSKSNELSECRSIKLFAGISCIKLSLKFNVSIVFDA